jgi:hypothetical protein
MRIYNIVLSSLNWCQWELPVRIVMQNREAAVRTILLLVLLPFVSHLLEFTGMHDCNPLADFSGLATGSRPPQLAQCLIDGNAGKTLQALGHRAAEDWLAGRLPWWNPYAGLGLPLAAEMQPAAFFLPFVILLHFASGLLLLKISMQIVAGFCMFHCLGTLGLSRGAALLGGLLYELDGTFAWFGDAPMLPLPFLPLLIAGIERARAATGSVGGVPEVAVGIGFSLLAGFPETAFVNGVLAMFWAALAMPPHGRARFIARVLGGGLVGLALAAPALVPFLDYIESGGYTYRFFVATNLLQKGQAAALLLPTLFGTPYEDFFVPAWGSAGGYIGAGIAMMGLAELFTSRRRGRIHLLALGWTLFWCAVFVGEPITRRIWQAIPALNLVVVTRYAVPSIAFLWTVLTALAWDRWTTGRLRAGIAAASFLALAAASVADCVATHRIDFTAGWGTVCAPVLTLAWALLLTATLAYLVAHPPSAIRRLILAASILADALISFTTPQFAGRPAATLDLAPVRFLASQPGYYRSYSLDGLLRPNYGSYFGIATIQAFTIPAPALWASYVPALDPRLMGEMFGPSDLATQARRLATARTGFAAAGVGYVLVPSDKDPVAKLNDPHFVSVFASPAARIYHMAGAAPYFDVVGGGPCAISPMSRTELTANCQSPAMLVRRELYYAGWRAEVNGLKAPISLAQPAFQRIMLPVGASTITFRYVPPHANLIVLLFSAGLTGLALALYRYRLKTRDIREPE